MSRRSFYRQTTRQQTTYVNDIDDKIVHWAKEWVSPSLSRAAAAAAAQDTVSQINGGGSSTADGGANDAGANPNSSGGNSSTTTLPFSVKMWVAHPETDEKDIPVKDCAEDDLLDLARYTVIKRQPEQAAAGSNDLTAADIRGAVGGEAIPGIASGYDAKPEDQPPKVEAPAAATEAPVVETAPVSVSEAVSATVTAATDNAPVLESTDVPVDTAMESELPTDTAPDLSMGAAGDVAEGAGVNKSEEAAMDIDEESKQETEKQADPSTLISEVPPKEETPVVAAAGEESKDDTNNDNDNDKDKDAMDES